MQLVMMIKLGSIVLLSKNMKQYLSKSVMLYIFQSLPSSIVFFNFLLYLNIIDPVGQSPSLVLFDAVLVISQYKP